MPKVSTRLGTIALAAAALSVGCRTVAPPIRVDGSTGVLPLVMALASDYRARNPRDSIAFGQGLGSSARLDAVAEGRIDIAMASHGVDTADLRRRGLVGREIARSAVIVAVNESVNVTALTRAQVCAVYAGTIASWRDLGGADREIVALMRPPNEVDAEVANEGIPCLRGVALSPRVRVIGRPEEMARALESTADAVGITSMMMAARSQGRLRAVALDGVAPTDAHVESGAYPLARRSILVTRRQVSAKVSRFLTFVSSAEGARVIRRNGAVPALPSATSSVGSSI